MKRIDSIDLLRGVAVLGILIMNIQSFSMPSAAYINPTAYGDLTGLNKWTWILSHVLADTKFMSLFSLLFGAGIILLTDKLISTDRPVRRIWYSRLFWLLLFGLAHAILLWPGDILVMYSICGFITFFFRNRSTKFLLRLAIVFFILPIALNTMQGLSWEHFPPDAIDGIMESWSPPDEDNALTIQILSEGSFMDRVEHRIEEYVGMFIYYFLFTGLWRIMAMMLFGMYFYKKGALSAEWENQSYLKLIKYCLPLALVLICYGVWFNFNKEWSAQYSMFLGINFNYIGSLFLAITYMSIIMIWSKSARWMGLQNLLKKAGKMAFTNYILMSVLSTTLFYRMGFFGSFSRMNQLLTTFIIWCIVLAFTHLWMRKYKMGPLEWLWRSLTYWKVASIK